MGLRGDRRRRDAAITTNFFNQTAPQLLSGTATPSTPATGTATTVSATVQVPTATTPFFATTAERDAFLAEISTEKAMLQAKIATMDGEMERLKNEIAAGRKVKKEVKEKETTEKVKDIAAAGKKKKKMKRIKKRAVVPTRLGVSGFAPGENPHKGKFVFGKVGGWRGDLEWMMAIGMKEYSARQRRAGEGEA